MLMVMLRLNVTSSNILILVGITRMNLTGEFQKIPTWFSLIFNTIH